MKKVFWVALIVLVFLVQSLASAEEQPLANTEEDRLTLVVGEWAPYIEQETSNQGFMSEIVVKAFERIGVKVEIKFRPWKRVEDEIDNENQVSYSWIWSEQRSKKWLFSNCYKYRT